jgi:hypothetical protein
MFFWRSFTPGLAQSAGPSEVLSAIPESTSSEATFEVRAALAYAQGDVTRSGNGLDISAGDRNFR